MDGGADEQLYKITNRFKPDRRVLQEVQINDNYAKLSKALYVAEQKAREAVAMRSKVEKEMAIKEKEKKECELRALAAKARSERTGVAQPVLPPPPPGPPPSGHRAMEVDDSRLYYGADEQLYKITNRFKPDKAFTGASEKAGKRERQVEFEKAAEEADPFGLDQFLSEVKTGKPKAMDKIGGGGTMTASAGSSRDGYDGSSGRSMIAFEKGGQ